MTDPRSADDRFVPVENLNSGGVFACLDGDQFIRVHDYCGADPSLFNMREARALRDWLNKVIP